MTSAVGLDQRAVAREERADAVGVGWLPAAVAVMGFRGTEDREERGGVAWGVEVLQVEPVVQSLFVVEPLELLRAHRELDRDHALWEHEHHIDLPAEPWDVELEVGPWGGGGWWRRDLILEGRTQDGQLQPPGGLLLRSQRVAARARERRVTSSSLAARNSSTGAA